MRILLQKFIWTGFSSIIYSIKYTLFSKCNRDLSKGKANSKDAKVEKKSSRKVSER